MNASQDLDRQLDTYLTEGPTELPEASFDAVRDLIEQERQRAVIGPWRMPDLMNRFATLGGGALALVLAVIVGSQLLARPATGGPGAVASPSPSPSPTVLGGSVIYLSDGTPTTTEVDVVVDGGTVSGTAVTKSSAGSHTVKVECAARVGKFWAVAGTTQGTTVPDGRVGDWSAVVVEDRAAQQIGIWISDPKIAGVDCDGWLKAIDIATIDAQAFNPIDSGELVGPAAPGS